MSMSTPSILIFTFSEHGQANVNLATSYELALAGANVTIASSRPLKTRVERLQEIVSNHTAAGPPGTGKPPGAVHFHECRGASQKDAWLQSGRTVTELTHPHGISGALGSYSKMADVLIPYPREEYLASVDDCMAIIADVKPDIAVVDILFCTAMDACTLAGQKWMAMVPNSYKEIALADQPWLAPLWKYPAVCSGFSFPLKWWEIPVNIYLNIQTILTLATSPRIKSVMEGRKSRGLSHPLFGQRIPGIKYICPSLPEIDFPLSVIPKEVISCGPIVLPFDPVEECDPGLTQWLDNGPTVLINLGSHILADETIARELCGALRMLLDYHDRKGRSNIQVLWKAQADGNIEKPIDDIIGGEIKAGRVKIVPWLEAEPVAILQHPNLVCTVHHGGANSWYEGIWSGVPHIVLPVWYDTYDYACRAEYLNVGLWGSHTSAPGVNAEEFGKVLIRITTDTEEAASFRMTAKHLKEVCTSVGNGRALSSKAILQEIRVGR